MFNGILQTDGIHQVCSDWPEVHWENEALVRTQAVRAENMSPDDQVCPDSSDWIPACLYGFHHHSSLFISPNLIMILWPVPPGDVRL